MKNKVICFDTNLLMDLILTRIRSQRIANQFAGFEISASTHSIATSYYYAKKELKISNEDFRVFINSINPISVNKATLDYAFEIANGNDLEDAIQISACKQAGIQKFATADKKLAKLYSDTLTIVLI